MTSSSRASALATATARPFRERLARERIALDAEQARAAEALCDPHPHGYYLWGDVGRGKSMLATRYFEAIPSEAKLRVHFTEFFRELQQRIVAEWHPLEAVLREMFGGTRAILFDEFHVHDVADAIYLTRTLEALVELDVLVIATSNYEPARLLPDPHFHDRFLPAIALIESAFAVVPIGAGRDYRVGGDAAPGAGFASGRWIIGDPGEGPTAPEGGERTRRMTFAELCDRPVGAWQYLALADAVRDADERLVVCEAPDLSTLPREVAGRLGLLVDVLADRDLPVDFVAQGHWSSLRDASEPPVDVERTLSRFELLEVVRDPRMREAVRGVGGSQ